MSRYILWLLPPAVMAIAAAIALGFWGAPVGTDVDGDFFELEFEGKSDASAAAVTMNRPGLPIEIAMDATTFALMCRVENRDLYKNRTVNINVRFGDEGEVRRPGVLTLRGRGSLKKSDSYPNYDVNLIRPVEFADGVKLKRFYLMNLHYDPHHLKMASSYRLLSEFGLFPLHFQFVRLKVAEENHGIFLLVEPPVAGLRRTNPECVGVFRRLRPNGYDIEWTASVPGIRTSLNRLRTHVDDSTNGKTHGDLGDSLDLPTYFRWLGLNALLRNVDTQDELFLYESRAQGAQPSPLQVLAWDYDDTFRSKTKEGALTDPLLFGCLDPLEEKVAADPDLYRRYELFLNEMLAKELTVDRVETVIRETQARRDSLDDGTAPDEQLEARNLRADYADFMVERIIRSHRALTKLATKH